jgi:hypothetical protein
LEAEVETQRVALARLESRIRSQIASETEAHTLVQQEIQALRGEVEEKERVCDELRRQARREKEEAAALRRTLQNRGNVAPWTL